MIAKVPILRSVISFRNLITDIRTVFGYLGINKYPNIVCYLLASLVNFDRFVVIK